MLSKSTQRDRQTNIETVYGRVTYLLHLFTLPYVSVLFPAVEVTCEGSQRALDIGGDGLYKFYDFLIG